MRLRQILVELRTAHRARRLAAAHDTACRDVAHELACLDALIGRAGITGYSLNRYDRGTTIDVHALGKTYRYGAGPSTVDALREAADNLLGDLAGPDAVTFRDHWWAFDALET